MIMLPQPLPQPLPQGRTHSARAPVLCVVVPVLNEAGNVATLVARLQRALDGIAWEAVFVDDGSTDGTRDQVAAQGAQDPRIRLLHRIRRRGLASAFIEGALSSLAPYIAAIDGDLQHDETLLPGMLAVLQQAPLASAPMASAPMASAPVDIVIGSRYVAGGDLGEWDARRAGMSGLATRLSQRLLRVPVADPMSGFFMVRRSAFERASPRLSGIGFKILLDLLASMPQPAVVHELPYRFGQRTAGASKLDSVVLLDFALLLVDKLVGPWVPVRFLLFAAVGALGLLWHVAVLAAGLRVGLAFEPAQASATAAAIAGNFVLNNQFTFSDLRLRGARLVRGFVVFAVVCAVGAVANLSVADVLVGAGQQRWWVAGIAGAAMSLVWNYAVGATLTWRRR